MGTRAETEGTGYTKKRSDYSVGAKKASKKPPKSKQSNRVVGGLGFTAVDITSMGLDGLINTAISG